jgi:hypothetical protein
MFKCWSIDDASIMLNSNAEIDYKDKNLIYLQTYLKSYTKMIEYIKTKNIILKLYIIFIQEVRLN